MMSHRRARTLSLTSLAAAAVLGLTMVGSPPAQAGGDHGSKDPKIIASGLNNPRQLSFTHSGDLLVAEAGAGGSGPCVTGPEGPVCFGASGSVTKISSRGRQSRIITGLPSFGGEGSGSGASGPSDVLAEGGHITVLIGLGANPAARTGPGMPALAKRLGTLVQTTRGGGLRTLGDVAAFEGANDPVPGPDGPDSNPVGFTADRGEYLVTDAGGNDLLSVHRGRVRLVSTFASTKVEFPPGSGNEVDMQAVPTSVATKGRDGAYYVSQLTGFPFPKGGASIFRVDPRTGARTVYATGLTNVTDLAFAGSTLYAVQISNDGLASPAGPVGSLVKVSPGASQPATNVIATGLFAPYGIAIKGNSAYVTTGSLAAGAGQVVRIRL